MTTACVASGSIPLVPQCRGFLLVELLIGLGLGLMLIAAVTTATQQLWGAALRPPISLNWPSGVTMGPGCWRLRLDGRGLLGSGPELDLHAKAQPRVFLRGYGC